MEAESRPNINDAIREALASEAYVPKPLLPDSVITVQTADGELKEMPLTDYIDPPASD
jgi:hypothetical protein